MFPGVSTENRLRIWDLSEGQGIGWGSVRASGYPTSGRFRGPKAHRRNWLIWFFRVKNPRVFRSRSKQHCSPTSAVADASDPLGFPLRFGRRVLTIQLLAAFCSDSKKNHLIFYQFLSVSIILVSIYSPHALPGAA